MSYLGVIKESIVAVWQLFFETVFSGSIARYCAFVAEELRPKTIAMIREDLKKLDGRVAWKRRLRKN